MRIAEVKRERVVVEIAEFLVPAAIVLGVLGRSLEQGLYGWDDAVESNTIEVHIHHLRKKLGTDLIRTIRGVGYMIEKPDE